MRVSVDFKFGLNLVIIDVKVSVQDENSDLIEYLTRN